MSNTIERVKERLEGPGPHAERAASLGPPLSADQVTAVEKRLGRPLPPFLRALVTEAADGGYGLEYGHLPLISDDADARTAVGVYETMVKPDPDDSGWAWPTNLLPLVELGCGMSFCVDLETPEGAVSWFEPNPRSVGDPLSESFWPLGIGLEELMNRWLNGDDSVDVLEEAAVRMGDN